jgi:predicted RNase H-like HicB family nuclease
VPYTQHTTATTTRKKKKRTETVQTDTYRYTALFEPAEEGGYVVTIPALDGIATQGETLAEARAMAADLIRCYLESLRKAGDDIPIEPAHTLTLHIAVHLPAP